jgi:hypothetical protein
MAKRDNMQIEILKNKEEANEFLRNLENYQVVYITEHKDGFMVIYRSKRTPMEYFFSSR